MTEIRHVDRHGKPWAFVLDCNTVQERMLKNVLGAVRNLGAREELNVKYYENEAANAAFWDAVENVVLSALKEWATTVTEESDAQGGNVHSLTAGDEPEPYYWENF